MLAADTRRAELLAEEARLLAEIDAQQEHSESGASDASVPGSSWGEAEWTEKLARLVAVGGELEASGADASEAKVGGITCAIYVECTCHAV